MASVRADFSIGGEDPQHYGLESALTYIWDVPTLSWVKNTGGGGGGGGAVTIADGADTAQGTTTDAAWVSGSGTVISLLKKIASPGGGGLTDAELRATPVPVSGTFFQATQPISAAALPLPTGAATAANQLPDGHNVTVDNASLAVTGPLTDAQLRATAVPVSGTAVNPATGQGKTLVFAPIAQGAAGTTALVSADVTRKVKVVSYVAILSATGTAKFTDGTADLTGAMDIVANGGVSAMSQPAAHILETAAVNRPLNIVTTGGAARGHISYFLEA